MSKSYKKTRQSRVALTRHRYLSGPQYDIAPNICAYCGLTGSITEDHVIPISGMAGLLDNRNLRSWIVPCCHECNVLISNKSPYAIGGINDPRRQFIRKRDMIRAALEKRYLKSSRGRTRAMWTEEELANGKVNPGQAEDDDKISYRLAQMVRASFSKEEILERLSYNCFTYY